MASRLPSSVPQVLASSGVGRGQKPQQYIPGMPVPVGNKKKVPVAQPYIPGMNQVTDPNVIAPVLPGMKTNEAKQVPKELVKSFLDGSKHPISALMEYGAMMKLVVTFEEAAVIEKSILNKFACVCKVNDRPFPQGTGKTKKDAKTAAAKIAFSAILGFEEDDLETDTDKVIYDAHGRQLTVRGENPSRLPGTSNIPEPLAARDNEDFAPKVALPAQASTLAHWEQPKHPISRLQEWCQRSGVGVPKYEVSDRPLEQGFRAVCLINEDPITEAYALTKKDAKKRAAEFAIMDMLPEHMWGFKKEELGPAAKSLAPLSSSVTPMNTSATIPGASITSPKVAPPGVVAWGVEDRGALGDLEHFCQEYKMSFMVEVSDVQGPDGYEATVEVNGEPVAVASGLTKKEAKQDAALSALDTLMSSIPVIPRETPNLNHYDTMQQVAEDAKNALLKPLGLEADYHRVYAAIISQRGEHLRGEVVAFGTGNKCVSLQGVTKDGRGLVDCHALAVARRAFRKYLHGEIESFFKGNVLHTIFEKEHNCPMLKVKDGITFHLYMSCAPCGDAGHFTSMESIPITDADVELMDQGYHYPTFSDDHHGCLRVKCSHGEATVPVSGQRVTSDGEPLVMSCSDKLLKWNIVGLQGAFLSIFCRPIYLSSITFGHQYDHGNAVRAFCCRVNDELGEQLPEGYRINHPYIGRATQYDNMQVVVQVSPHSINWCSSDQSVEIIDVNAGRSTPLSPFRASAAGASRLCRAGFLHRYRQLAQMAQHKEIAQEPHYNATKKHARDYYSVLHLVKTNLSTNQFGTWNQEQIKIY